MSTLLLRPLGFGEVLDGAFGLYRRHFAVLFTTALISMLPIALATGTWMQSLVSAGGEPSAGTLLLVFMVMVIGGLAMVLVWGALTWQTGRMITGAEVSVGEGYGQAARRFVPLLVAGIVAYVTIVASGLAVVLVGGIVAAVLTPAGPVVSALATTVVFLGFGAVMFGMMAAFFAVVPAVVIERSGPIAALGRSWRLSRGARLRILGVLLVSWLIVMLPIIGVMFAAGMGALLVDPQASTTLSTGQLVFQQVLSLLSGALTFPFLVGCMTLLYYDRRVRTEALDLELAAESLVPVS